MYCTEEEIMKQIVREEEKILRKKEIDVTTQETKAVIDKIVKNLVSNYTESSWDSRFIKYKPISDEQPERIIQMLKMAADPFEPPKFKHTRLPKGSSGSPPVPVVCSPPRPVTLKDQQEWRIPPCVSDWKNQKGYTIPLDKRLPAADHGHRLQTINGDFSNLCEALYVAEQKAREDIAMRLKVEKEMAMKEKEKNERQLRDLARKSRSERAAVSEIRDEGRLQRERVREERRKERAEKERSMGAAGLMRKRTKIDRDISEKVALGMATTNSNGREVLYDERLFNQEKGMDSGFSNDEAYNIFDKGLFSTQQSSTIDTLYKPNKKEDVHDEMYGGADHDQQVEINLMRKADRFKRKAFTGASERITGRHVEFENDQIFKSAQEKDVFGLDKFLADINVCR